MTDELPDISGFLPEKQTEKQDSLPDISGFLPPKSDPTGEAKKTEGFWDNLSYNVRSALSTPNPFKVLYNVGEQIKSGDAYKMLSRVFKDQPVEDQEILKSSKEESGRLSSIMDDMEEKGQTNSPAYKEASQAYETEKNRQIALQARLDKVGKETLSDKANKAAETVSMFNPAFMAKDYIAKKQAEDARNAQIQDIDFESALVANKLDDMHKQGLEGTPAYDAMVEHLDKLHEQLVIAHDSQEVSTFEMLKSAGSYVINNPKEAAAEMVNAITADPELAVSPVGYGRPAQMAAKYGKLARIGAGMAGVAGTAAAINVPLSIEQQLEQSGTFDPAQVRKESIVAGAIAAPVVGALKGTGGLIKGSTRLIGETGRNILRSVEEFDPELKNQNMGAAQNVTIKVGPDDYRVETPSMIKDLFRTLIDVTGGKASTRIKQADTPAFKKIGEIFTPDETGETATKATHFERVSMNTGKYTTWIQDVKNKAMRAGIKADDFDAEGFAGLIGEKVSARMQPFVKELRGVLDQLYAYEKAGGVDVKYRANFYPINYVPKKINTKKGSFQEVLWKYGLDRDVSDNIVKRIINKDEIDLHKKNNISRLDFDDPDAVKAALFSKASRNKAGIGGSSAGIKAPHLEKARVLDHIPERELAPFIETDVVKALVQYAEQSVNRTEWVRSFGKDGAKLNKMLYTGLEEAKLSGRTIKKDQISRVYDLADALQHNFRPIQSVAVKVLNKTLTTTMNVLTLPLAVIVSLSEAFIPLLRAPAIAYLKSIPAAINHSVRETVRVVFKKVPMAEGTKALEELGLGTKSALHRLSNMFAGDTTAISNAFFKVTMLHAWTQFTRVIANETGKEMIKGHLKAIAGNSRNSAKYIRELNELGIDYKKGIEWLNSGANEHEGFGNVIRRGGLRFTNEVIMNPNSANTPMWHSNPHLAIFKQLKGFQTVFGNTVVKRMARELFQRGVANSIQQATKYAIVVGMMTYTAMLANEAKDTIRGTKRKGETDGEKWHRAFMSTGFTGAIQFGLDSASRSTYGSPVETIAGPTVSKVSELVKASYKLYQGNKKPAAELAASLVPFASVNRNVKEKMVDSMVGKNYKPPKNSRGR